MNLEDHPDFIGFSERGVCMWRRRRDGPPKKIRAAPIQTMGATQTKQLGGWSANSAESTLNEHELQDFRASWIVSKSNTTRSFASVVSNLLFGSGGD